jgi:hypothetical protein
VPPAVERLPAVSVPANRGRETVAAPPCRVAQPGVCAEASVDPNHTKAAEASRRRVRAADFMGFDSFLNELGSVDSGAGLEVGFHAFRCESQKI